MNADEISDEKPMRVHASSSPPPRPDDCVEYSPRLIALELTRSCPLACRHCRAAASPGAYPDELSTGEYRRLLDNIASFTGPTIILTGGEPMLRPDVYDIASYATGLGLRVVLASCGAPIDDESAARLLESGVRHVSISLDGATARSHDNFRGVDGAFASAIGGIEAAKRAGLGFQINTTVTKDNVHELPAICDLAAKLGASVFNPFLLVPTGRGIALADRELSPAEYERTLHRLARLSTRGDIGIRVTCAPHYQRVIRRLGLCAGEQRPPAGCMGGKSFAFVSHRGKVQICGFLDLQAGDLRKEDFDFRRIWKTSELFSRVRDLSSYSGRCGYCEFARVCGGCRARAYALTGDYLADEPFCLYQPRRTGPGAKPQAANGFDDPGDTDEIDELDEIDKKILSIIQTGFPVVARPFRAVGKRIGADESKVIRRVARLRETGVVRRLGAVFDSRSLGYASTLVAGRVAVDRLADVAKIVNALPGVTHNYRRRHAYNLWFTLTAESERRLGEIVEDLRRRTGIGELFMLPALTVYKIRVNFPLAEGWDSSAAGYSAPTDRSPEPVEMTEDQKRLVRLLQEDLPLVPKPFAELADKLGWPVDRVTGQVRDWLAAGVVRRLGAVVRHRRLGFTANGMCVLGVTDRRIDEVGRRLAGRSEVSHCYRRRPLPDFDYNLFAMLHGRSAERVRTLAAELAKDANVADYLVLFSTTEYKKTSMKYFQ